MCFQGFQIGEHLAVCFQDLPIGEYLVAYCRDSLTWEYVAVYYRDFLTWVQLYPNEILALSDINVVHNFTSSLISDQMKGKATNPPTTIPSRAVSTAEPGTITARL